MESQLILDRYRPLSDLGEGGYGSVTLAWDTRMQRKVAIKRLGLPVDTFGHPQLPPGLAEARTAAMLHHPAIVTVFDFDTDSDEAFLVMEYVDGASLEELLGEVDGPLSLDETAAIAEAVSQAVTFAHENGVLHLDIKPGNVLISRDGHVKVADFGMAELSSVTGHGPAFGGTPGYMPLEQLEGLQVSTRADEWALAVLVYECLTAENPFAAITPEDAATAIRVYEPVAPSLLVSGLPHPLDDVLLAALAPASDERYPSVAEFADHLLPLLGDPREGRAALADILDEITDDELADKPGLRALGLWDRLQGPAGSVLLRAIAAAEAGWLAWAGLAPLPLESAAHLAATALVAAAAALAPGLGTGLGLIAFAIGLFAAGSPLVGVVFAFGAVLWWWFAARRSAAAAVLPLSAPVFGIASLSPAAALLAGFALTPLWAAGAALVAGALSMLASAGSAAGPPFAAVDISLFSSVWDAALAAGAFKELGASPAPLAVLVAWPLAAAIVSMASRRANRVFAVVGTLAGSAVLYGGYVAAYEIARAFGDSAAGGWKGPGVGFALGGSLILMFAVIALGAPVRAEEERWAKRSAAVDDAPDDEEIA